MLPTQQQLKVFEDPPAGHRLCVVATNVAETSLTIPNIRYVIDVGKAKEKHYDSKSNISNFKIDWISKASADQVIIIYFNSKLLFLITIILIIESWSCWSYWTWALLSYLLISCI
ncbi:hypothetical protein K502DRAFT_190518 [Neoconidiobolus thromboides FSU 785]|nr:hypothetical protein K502DRAFT_190518 [Neoconidiobolus thromboides FSU 785]